jgi:hypothetical protein
MPREQDGRRNSDREDARDPALEQSDAALRYASKFAVGPNWEGELSPSQLAFDEPVDLVYVANSPSTKGTRNSMVGAIVGDSVEDMVQKVLTMARGYPIRSLTIYGDGAPGRISAGEGGDIDTSLTASERQALLRLRGRFVPNASVALHGSEVAAGDRGEKLLLMLASLLKVTVRAGVSYQAPGSHMIHGSEAYAARTLTSERPRISMIDSPRNERVRAQGPDKPIAWAHYAQMTDDELALQVDMDTRYEVVVQCLKGSSNEREQELILRMFRTAAPSERKRLFRQVEAHRWGGALQHGWLTDDDGLWENLSEVRRVVLERLLNHNGGAGGSW